MRYNQCIKHTCRNIPCNYCIDIMYNVYCVSDPCEAQKWTSSHKCTDKTLVTSQNVGLIKCPLKHSPRGSVWVCVCVYKHVRVHFNVQLSDSWHHFFIFFWRSKNFCRLSTGISSTLMPWLLALRHRQVKRFRETKQNNWLDQKQSSYPSSSSPVTALCLILVKTITWQLVLTLHLGLEEQEEVYWSHLVPSASMCPLSPSPWMKDINTSLSQYKSQTVTDQQIQVNIYSLQHISEILNWVY